LAISVKYLNPFIEGASSILNQTCHTEVAMGKPHLKNSPFETDSVAVIIGITGDVKGQVIFTMTTNNAKKIASRMMMGMEVNELDDMSKSAISELTNMILGTTATNFSKLGVTIDITPPSLLLGNAMQISTSKAETLGIPLNMAEIGVDFEINIALQENDK